ncbi:TPA: hypothetical protein ACH3X2_002506 [Trebouxia sp. C0005]
MAIGPWHARMHKPACQRHFGVGCTPESGLTYGAHVEHLWSTLRKTTRLLKYMSMAYRQDALTALMSRVELAKEDKLSVTPARWYNSAKSKAMQYSERLECLERDGMQDLTSQEQYSELHFTLAVMVVCSYMSPILLHLTMHDATSCYICCKAPLCARQQCRLNHCFTCDLHHQDKLCWRHDYQMCLEKLFTLTALTPPAQDTLFEADSLSEYQNRQELATAIAKARSFEQKHKLIDKWSQDSDAYQQAMLERKAYWVDCLQRNIAADLDALHVPKLAADRTSRQHRSTSSSLMKQARAPRILLEKSVQQLQEWHIVSGDIGPVPHDSAALSVADMEQQGWVVPCFTCSLNQSALHDQVVDMQQRVVRCQEEVQIVVRETQDAAAFYTQQLGTLIAAVEASEAGGLVFATTALQTLGTVVSTDDSETAHQYNKGQPYILHCKEVRCQRLLVSVTDLLAKLTTADVSSSLTSMSEAMQSSGSLSWRMTVISNLPMMRLTVILMMRMTCFMTFQMAPYLSCTELKCA